MKVLFGIALRQTTGFVESLLSLIDLNWAAPNFSTLSRHQKTLQVNIPNRGSDGPLRAKQHGAALLVFRLHRDKTHGGAQHRFDNGLSIRRIILLTLDEWLHVDWRDQAHTMAKLLEFAAPAVRRGASLHGNNAGRLLGKERRHLTPRKLLAKHNQPVVAPAMQLKTRFARSIPMMVTSDMDVLSFCDGFNNHHIGTSQCRQEGASTPSTEPYWLLNYRVGGLACAPGVGQPIPLGPGVRRVKYVLMHAGDPAATRDFRDHRRPVANRGLSDDSPLKRGADD